MADFITSSSLLSEIFPLSVHKFDLFIFWWYYFRWSFISSAYAHTRCFFLLRIERRFWIIDIGRLSNLSAYCRWCIIESHAGWYSVCIGFQLNRNCNNIHYSVCMLYLLFLASFIWRYECMFWSSLVYCFVWLDFLGQFRATNCIDKLCDGCRCFCVFPFFVTILIFDAVIAFYLLFAILLSRMRSTSRYNNFIDNLLRPFT